MATKVARSQVALVSLDLMIPMRTRPQILALGKVLARGAASVVVYMSKTAHPSMFGSGLHPTWS
jgi:hypothetical protein